MSYFDKDNEYKNITKTIMNNKQFLEIDTCVHHGLSRLDHSLRVSYYSYKIAKKMKWDYNKIAVAGLLHDFYIEDDGEYSNKFKNIFTHPNKAMINSMEIFNISEKEQNIICSHMFPLVPNKLPKYKESVLVGLVDKAIATYEFCFSFRRVLKFKMQEVPIVLALIISKMSF